MEATKRISLSIFTIVFILIMSCKEDKKEAEILIEEPIHSSEQSEGCPSYILKEKKNNLNISVLLDLSDRIEKLKTREKDSSYLASLSQTFVEHVKKKKLILLEDKMQLFFNPEPSDEKINKIAEKLKISFTKDTPKPYIEQTLGLYAEKPSELYELAIDDAEIAKKYPGSDIWRFFKDNVKDYCIDECHRNILVILTDGYMYYEGSIMNDKNRTSYLTPKSLDKLKLNTANWEDELKKRDLGFIPATADLSDLEVLVIGISNQNENNPYSQDIIETYWSNWLEEMGVKRYKVKNADLPSSIEKVISDFILKI